MKHIQENMENIRELGKKIKCFMENIDYSIDMDEYIDESDMDILLDLFAEYKNQVHQYSDEKEQILENWHEYCMEELSTGLSK